MVPAGCCDTGGSGLRLALVMAGLWALCCAQPVRADTPHPTRFTHGSWTSKDGVPSMVQSLAQTRDGYLWLGTGDGLYRFDGVTFEHIAPAPDHPRGAIPVSAVLVTRKGELWAGYSGSGGVEVYRGGRMVRAGMPDPPGEITQLAEDLDGAIWAVGGRGRRALKRYRAGTWQGIDSSWGVPDKEFVASVLAARDGTLWLATNTQLLFLRHGAKRFEATGLGVAEGASMAEDPHGHVWLSDPSGTRMLPDYPRGARVAANPAVFPPSGTIRRTTILFDREGSLWGSTFTSGIFRIPAPEAAGQPTGFGTANGLSSNQAVAVFQDREGNIWVGTEMGLDQFRISNVSRVDPPAASSAFGYLIAADDTGTVYLASGPTLYRADPGGEPRPVLTGQDEAQALCRGGDGTIWLGLPGRMIRLRGGKPVETLALPDRALSFGCGEDSSGRLWVARFDHGLLMRDARGWRRIPLPPGAPGRPQDVVIDGQGNPVIILDRHALVRITGSIATAWSNDRIGVTGITTVHGGPDGLFVGGGQGLARYRDGRFARLDIADHPWLRGVRGMVQTRAGQTWMVNNHGIIRIATADLDRAFAHPGDPIPHKLLDEQDGFASRTQRSDGLQMAAGSDGRLWFLTRQGVVRVDPNHLVRNAAPPPVKIRALTADRHRYVDPASLTLGRGTRNLSIEYTALSLSVPSRVRFRYMLEGVDKDWVDPGTRRQAFYTNLAPGTYRFRVIAANNDGVWNHTGATLEFTIRPTFFQSWPFYALCVAAALLATWLVYRLRLRRMAARMRMRLAERLAERERIARELHDTLLQGVQALVLRFQLVADDMPPDQPARRALEEALDRADDVLAEGRDRVRDLRMIGAPDDIEHMILDIARKQAFDSATRIHVSTEGQSRPLDPLVCDEVARIANEALFNIWRHAHARTVEVVIGFRTTAFTVRFRDDGVGMALDIVRCGEKPGHFGLTGMRERARKLGAEFGIDSGPGKGTEIVLIVPAGIAYTSIRKGRKMAVTAGDGDD
ncbi:sensor histidine kinase [Sphingomonas sp. dw_22]|uniref:sensor histidine kinase n=1 Tax=Sphingomonas sp. dw_22 TaxID=2721175 RepID=UPI001BD4D3E4|nr:sensor histidine kinase [Sphingomonas sp. dw_22]